VVAGDTPAARVSDSAGAAVLLQVEVEVVVNAGMQQEEERIRRGAGQRRDVAADGDV